MGKLQRDFISFDTNLSKKKKNMKKRMYLTFHIRVFDVFNAEHERSHSSFVEN